MKPPKFPGRKITYSPYHLNLPFSHLAVRTTLLAYAQSTPIVKLFLNTPKKSLLKSKHRKKRPHFLFYKKNLNGISNPQKILSERFLIPPKTLLKSRHKKEPNFLLRKILKGKLQTQRKSFDHHRH